MAVHKKFYGFMLGLALGLWPALGLANGGLVIFRESLEMRPEILQLARALTSSSKGVVKGTYSLLPEMVEASALVLERVKFLEGNRKYFSLPEMAVLLQEIPEEVLEAIALDFGLYWGEGAAAGNLAWHKVHVQLLLPPENVRTQFLASETFGDNLRLAQLTSWRLELALAKSADGLDPKMRSPDQTILERKYRETIHITREALLRQLQAHPQEAQGDPVFLASGSLRAMDDIRLAKLLIGRLNALESQLNEVARSKLGSAGAMDRFLSGLEDEAQYRFQNFQDRPIFDEEHPETSLADIMRWQGSGEMLNKEVLQRIYLDVFKYFRRREAATPEFRTSDQARSIRNVLNQLLFRYSGPDVSLAEVVSTFPIREAVGCGAMDSRTILLALSRKRRFPIPSDIFSWVNEVSVNLEGMIGPQERNIFVSILIERNIDRFERILENSSLTDLLELRRISLYTPDLDIYFLTHAVRKAQSTSDLNEIFLPSFLEEMRKYNDGEAIQQYMDEVEAIRRQAYGQ